MTPGEIQVFRARAEARKRPCEGGDNDRCGATSIVKCCNPECGLERCAEHVVDFSGYCDHEWRTIDDGANADVLALLDIAAGSVVAPPDAEIDAHAAAGGLWMVRAEWRTGRQSIDFVKSFAPQIAKLLRDEYSATWWMALDSMPCARTAIATQQSEAQRVTAP